ncbi:MAG: DNA polymerase III subunit gamma/tau, partial [Candidatus Omnitrophota bacterium]
MSYIVFALKWRPKNFDEIVGQEHVVTALKSSIEKDRVAHAYLFAGPRGVGKTSAARILAKALNCSERKTPNPCGKCPSCLDITGGRSMDVMEIDGASNRGIDEIRTLRENVKFAPTQGKFKVYIIDEVHQITPDGFNALLKTLEEPPPFVKFIFATTSPNKVMPTILSRCQRLEFRRISVLEIMAQLEKVCAAEKIEIDTQVLAAIARSSDGALRDAESILDQLISFSKGKVSLEDIHAMLGLVEHEVLFEVTEAIIKKDVRGVLVVLNKIIDEGKDTGVFLQNLIEHFRNLMVAKVAQADAQLIDLPEDVCKRLEEQSKGLVLEDIFSAFTVLAGAQDMAKRLESSRIPLEIGLARLAHGKKDISGGGNAVKPVGQAERPPVSRPVPRAPDARPVAGRPQEKKPGVVEHRPLGAKPLEKKLFENKPLENKPFVDIPMESPFKKDNKDVSGVSNVAPVYAAVTRSKQEEAVQTLEEPETLLTLKDVQPLWQEAISRLTKVKASAAHYLSEGSLVQVKNNVLTVTFPRSLSFHKESLETSSNKGVI